MKRLAIVTAGILLSGSLMAQTDSTSNTQESDTVKVGNFIIIKKNKDGNSSNSNSVWKDWDRNFDIKIERRNRAKRNISTNWWIMDLGFTNFRDQTNYTAAQAGSYFRTFRSADGPVNESEVVFLENVAGIFGFSSAEFARIRASHMASAIDDPWLILGINAGSNIDIAQKAWKELAAQNHPDKMIANGVPKELLGMANEKLAIINSAYDRILKAHKIKAGSEET